MIIRPKQQLKTEIWLPPGALTPAQVRKILRLAFDRYVWFKPKKLRFEGPEATALKEGPAAIGMMVKSYIEDENHLLVSGHTYQDQLSIRSGWFNELNYTGTITWRGRVRSARKPEWKEAHVDQVVQIMRMVDSPLATTCTVEDYENKTCRYDPHPEGLGTVLRFTTTGYDEGLVGLFWRNFFGPPFVRLFGDKLQTLPPDRAHDLGGGIWLVEPYDSPEQAGTDEARARERELIQLLGPECFYDQERDTKATRTLDLPVLDDEGNQSKRGASRKKAVQKKLGEYWTWAKLRWKEEGAIVRATREGYLLLSSGSAPLTKAVLDWGLSHAEDPLFLKRTPDEVAMYLEAKGEVPGRPIHPDARAELARIRATLGDEGLDALIRLLPAMRDVEAALKELARGSREAKEMLPRVEVIRKLGELLTFIPKPAQ